MIQVLAVDRKDVADQQGARAGSTGSSRPASSRRLCRAPAPMVMLEGLRRVASHRQSARRATPRRCASSACDAIGAGLRDAVGAPVVQSLQLALQLSRSERQPHVQLERRGINLRRQRPAAPLELVHDDFIEVHDIQRAQNQGGGQYPEQQAPQRKTSGAGGRRLYCELITDP